MDGDEEQERAMAKYADDGENIALPIRLAILRPTFFPLHSRVRTSSRSCKK